MTTIVLALCPWAACNPSVVSVDALLSQSIRSLELWNSSTGYVAFRVQADDGAATATAVLPPGGEFNANMQDLFGTVCPSSVRIEVFAYARARPDVSPLEDESLASPPYASTAMTLTRDRHFGCRADRDIITLTDGLFCDVLAVSPDGRRIVYQAGSATAMFELIAQGDADRGLPDPPPAALAQGFPLVGRLVDQDGRGIAGATVTIVEMGIELLTDADGRFEVSRPSGNYGIRVSADGYAFDPAGLRVVHRSPQSGPVLFIGTRKQGDAT